MPTNPYTDGLHALSQEVFAVLQNQDHPDHNPDCEACHKMQQIANVLLGELSGRITQNDMFGLAIMLHDINYAKEPDPPYFSLDNRDDLDDLHFEAGAVRACAQVE